MLPSVLHCVDLTLFNKLFSRCLNIFCVVSLLIFASFCVDICVDFWFSFSFIYCLFILAPVLFALLTSFPCVCVLKFSSFVGGCLCLFCWSFESALFSCLRMLFKVLNFVTMVLW